MDTTDTSLDLVCLLGSDGERVQPVTPAEQALAVRAARLTPDDLRQMLRWMVLARRFDEEATALQRQGELALFAPARGQEGAQAGSALALSPGDMAFPSYREHLVALARGVDLADVLRLFRGQEHGGWDSERFRFHLYTLVIGAHTLHATGYATGVRRDGAVGNADPEKNVGTVVYFGDGATSEGDVNEALGFAAVGNEPVVFFCQNNQWAISVPTHRQSRVPVAQHAQGFGIPALRVDGNDPLACWAAADQALERARSGGGPTFIEAVTYRMGAHTTSDDPTRYRRREEEELWAGRDPIARTEAYLRGLGQWDDARAAVLTAEADAAAQRWRTAVRDMPEPTRESVFAHVYATEHQQVTADRDGAIGLGASHTTSAPPAGAAPEPRPAVSPTTLPLVKAVTAALRNALQVDDRVVVMGEDVGALGGVFRATDGLLAEFGAHRVVDTPLAESGIVGTAIGLALRGYRPVCEIQFDGFVFPAFNQITTQLAKMQYRSGGRLTLPVVIRIPYGGGIGAVEHHSESPEALFAHTPGLRVVTPADAGEAYVMLQEAIACPDPVIFFEPKSRYWVKGQVDLAAGPYAAGRGVAGAETEVLARAGAGGAETLNRARLVPVSGTAGVPAGSAQANGAAAVTLVGYGPTVAVAQKAAETLTARGVRVEIIDLRTLSPLDIHTVAASVQRTGRAVVIHEAPAFHGVGGEVAAAVTERCFYYLESPVVRVAGATTPYPAAKAEHHWLPTAGRVVAAVERLLEY